MYKAEAMSVKSTTNKTNDINPTSGNTNIGIQYIFATVFAMLCGLKMPQRHHNHRRHIRDRKMYICKEQCQQEFYSSKTQVLLQIWLCWSYLYVHKYSPKRRT